MNTAGHLAARGALQVFTGAPREGGHCCIQAQGVESEEGRLEECSFSLVCLWGVCHLASSLLLRILGQVWSVRAFVGNLSVGARVSLYSALFIPQPSWHRGLNLGGPAQHSVVGRSEAATEVEPGQSWFIYRGQMIKARRTGLHPCLELR